MIATAPLNATENAKLQTDELFCGAWINLQGLSFKITRIKGVHLYRLRIDGKIHGLYKTHREANIIGSKATQA